MFAVFLGNLPKLNLKFMYYGKIAASTRLFR